VETCDSQRKNLATSPLSKASFDFADHIHSKRCAAARNGAIEPYSHSIVRLRFGVTAMADNGLITVPSAFGVKDAIDRLESHVRSAGMTVFARVDHAAGAKEAGLALRPTLLLIFGNAKAGTPLMQSQQTIGIDLPLKVLGWEDAAGKAWLTYNDPAWLATRHGDPAHGGESARLMSVALGNAVNKAAGP
jgi:uncharacterized protein (DUF302 family)